LAILREIQKSKCEEYFPALRELMVTSPYLDPLVFPRNEVKRYLVGRLLQQAGFTV
jgi:hypothetical protein